VQLVEFARRAGLLIIEDDYDGELRYDTAPLPLLAAMAPDVVVHLGTTSKILSPALGVGWLVAAPEVTEAVVAHRERTGTGPSPAGQRVLAEFARYGDLARHLRRMRRMVPPRRALVVDELRRRGLAVIGDDAGSHVVVPLASAAAEKRALEAGRARGVALDGLARHHLVAQRHPLADTDAGPPRTFGIALGYTALDWADLRVAVPLAAESLARL
jgi:GntR family transcriptional regulator/MocR family aminotransferase